MNSLNIIQCAVDGNDWVPFNVAASCFGKTKTAIHTYAEAAGEPDNVFNPTPFGCGGISEDLGFAWQCRRELYLSFLKNVNDKTDERVKHKYGRIDSAAVEYVYETRRQHIPG